MRQVIHLMITLAGLTIMVPLGLADEGLLAYLPADGDTKMTQGGTAVVSRGSAEDLRFVPGHAGQGVYLPLGTTLSIPVTGLNPQAGTLSFWFRPDWSDPSYQDKMLVELLAGDAWQLRWRYGYPHIPSYNYVTLETSPDWKGGTVGGSFRTDSHNLFTGGEWRHYVLRWSAERAAIEMLVDGYRVPSSGRYATDQHDPLAGRLLLHGGARGAFDDVRVYDRWLDENELLAAGGAQQVRGFLQEQQPPPGAPRAGEQRREISYVDPGSGELVKTTVTVADTIYNPDNIPGLPETPHTKWARPLAGGPIKVLLIMPSESIDVHSSLREGIELWQRLDMDCDIVSKPDDEVMRRDYDVIVVGHQGFDGILRSWWSENPKEGTFMDPQVRQWLTDRVLSGKSGLVLVNPKWWGGDRNQPGDALLHKAAVGMTPERRTPADALLRGFPATVMNRAEPVAQDDPHAGGAYVYRPVYALDESFFLDPERLASEVAQVYRDPTVRIVVLEYRLSQDGRQALTPGSVSNSAATAVHYDYWMALMARAVLLAAGREPAARVESLDIAGDRWTAKITGEAHRVTYRARDLWGREYAAGEAAVEGGQATLDGAVLPPRAVVDLILKNEAGEVLDWYSQAVPAAKETRISGITLDRAFYAKGDDVSGQVTFQTETPGDYLLQVYLGDHEERRLVRQEIPVRLGAGETQASFTLKIPPSADSRLMRVDAVLQRGDEIVDERSADCPVPETEFAGFFAGMSDFYDGGGNGAIERMRRRLFRDRYGVNLTLARYSGNIRSVAVSRDNLAYYSYITHLGNPRDEESFKPWIENWDDFFPAKLFTKPEDLLAYRPLFYSLGEEHYLTLSGSRHPKAVALFQDYLQGRYDNLDQLNEVWQAQFTSWNEVPMLEPETTDVMKLNFGVQAHESRRFMEHLFAQKHSDLADWLRARDPEARVGIHIGWDLWMGRAYDYWLLSRGMDSMIGYGGVQNQYIRSFFKNYYGSWWHYNIGDLDQVRWHPWSMLINGAHGFMWYSMAPEKWGAATADLHPSSDWVAAAPDFMAATRAGDLLSRTAYDQDQVAIHYSQDSMHAGMGAALSWLHNNIVNLLFDDGVPFHFVSYEELADGKANGTPLLILPGSISLSPGEVEAIRAYVRQGGTVWADRLPGTHDQHGRKLDKSLLADLFANLEEHPLPSGGTMQVSRDGRVILAPLDNYAYSRNVGEHLPMRELLDAIVTRAGVKRVARAVAADGSPANATWMAGYHKGSQRYLVAAKDYAVADRAPSPVEIILEEPAHVYDALAGRYLGFMDRFKDTFETARGKVYSLLPYEVKGLTARARTGWLDWLTGKARRGEDLTIDVSLETPGTIGPEDLHLLRVSVTGPDGSEVTALRRLVSIYGGKGEVRLPLAWTDPAGVYTVHLHDTATGHDAEVQVRLN